MRLLPGRYRDLAGSSCFALSLPAGYRAVEVLAYHGRDPASRTERRAGNRIWKALMTEAAPVVLEVTVGARTARVRVHAEQPPGGLVMGRLHACSLAMLGLDGEVEPFESEHGGLVAGREGLRVALLPSAFEALSWGIIGQQINLAFAASLRREVIALAGVPIGSMRAYPTAEAVARIAPSDLRARRFSSAKADYLIDAANAVACGALPLERLLRGSAIAAERALTGRRGIGIWTARYVLMRTGFADAAPVGDSGLATALQRVFGIAQRPDAGQTARLMSRFSPDRALASAHLWASLHDRAAAAEADAGRAADT
jgi:AraC family transcriptional regulator of adaptative response / DNA-3-methyladenine glycosylase II